MAIGAADLSAKAKRGWSWRFGQDGAMFAEWEGKLKEELERQGLIHNIRRLELDEARSMKIAALRESMRDASDEQLDAALAAFGK
jgi:hypothetical protein